MNLTNIFSIFAKDRINCVLPETITFKIGHPGMVCTNKVDTFNKNAKTFCIY